MCVYIYCRDRDRVNDRVHDSRVGRFEWCSLFAQYAGVQYLVRLVTDASILKYDVEKHGPKRIHDMVMALLFKIINNFLSTDKAYKSFYSDMGAVALPGLKKKFRRRRRNNLGRVGGGGLNEGWERDFFLQTPSPTTSGAIKKK